MTPEQSAMLESLSEQSNEIHDWLFKKGQMQQCRSEQLDDMMGKYRSGRIFFKTVVWIGAGLVTLAAGWDKIKGVIQ